MQKKQPSSQIFEIADDPENSIQEDPKAQKESAVFAGNDEARKEGIKSTFHTLVIWGLRCAAIAIFSLLIVRVWHLFSPADWMWLDAPRLQKIDSLLFSGTLGGLISKYLGEIVHNDKAKK